MTRRVPLGVMVGIAREHTDVDAAGGGAAGTGTHFHCALRTASLHPSLPGETALTYVHASKYRPGSAVLATVEAATTVTPVTESSG